MSPGLLNPFRSFGTSVGDPFDTEVLADAPVVYYKHAEASGTVMVDSSGHAVDGTYVASPTFGGAAGVTLDGVSQYGDIPTATLPAGDSPYTLETVFKPSSVSGSHCMIGLGSGGTNRASSLITTGTNVQNYWNSSNVTTSGVTITTSAWWHVMAVYNLSSLTVYVSAVSRGTAARSSHACLYGAGHVGTTELATSAFFAGQIRRTAIYNTALSSTRVSAHFAAAPLT